MFSEAGHPGFSPVAYRGITGVFLGFPRGKGDPKEQKQAATLEVYYSKPIHPELCFLFSS